MPVDPQKRYLGDAVYVTRDWLDRLVLFTDNGEYRTNRIVLEPEVWAALLHYVEQEKEEASA